MNDSVVIDKIFRELSELCRDTSFNFHKFIGTWGFKGSTTYHEKELDFIDEIQRLARAVSIRYHEGNYYLFDGRIYVVVRRELIEMAYDELVRHLRIVPMIGAKTIRTSYFMNAIRFYNPLNVRNDVVAFSNGVLDMSDLSLQPFSRDWHITYYHPYPYDAKAKCHKWHAFLHEVLPDKNSRLILQMFMGLGLIERGSLYDCSEGEERSKVELCLILIGSGANGKSVIYQTAMGIFGRKRISGVDYDELTSSGDEGMRARRLLRDALFNWSSDSDSRTFGRKRTGVFKRIVSGEAVTDRKIGEDVKENDKMPYLVFNLNELPFPDDQSLGFIRRLQFIHFDVIIEKAKQNKSLAYELVSEYSGIFNWVMRGARELRRRKFVFPSSEGSRRQILLTQLNVNPILAWVNAYEMRTEAKVKNEVGVYIPASDLLASLERFCEDNNVTMVSRQKFGQTMSRIGRGFFKKRNGTSYSYKIFGCDSERIKQPFIVNFENMKTTYIEEKGTFIKEED